MTTPTKLERYLLYRTKPLGWQKAGWVLLTGNYNAASPPSPFPNTAWAEDTDNHYGYGDIYPGADAPSAPPE